MGASMPHRPLGETLSHPIQGRETINRILTILAAGACAGAFAALAASAQAAPDVSLTRFECGTPQAPIAVNQRFSDTYAYGDLKLQFVFSCYLIKHGDEYLLWDTGHAMTTPNVAPKVSLVDLLAKIDRQARADQICRHQPLSRRSHRPGGLVSEGDAADRQRRLGCDHQPEAGPRRELQAVRELDQRREQGRTARARQGCVRRRHA